MILDERGEFADALAANTGAAGSYLLGDVIDLTATGADIGQGTEIWLVGQVDTTFTSGGSGTYAFSLASDAQAAIAVDGSQTEHFRTAAYPVASLVAGFLICAVRLPLGTYERYLGIIQTTAVAAATAGKVNFFLTRDVAKIKHYADAVN